jgi:hypothetical protein
LKTILQLLVVALVINACVQGGSASWKHFKFKDAVEQEARFSEARTADALEQRILEIAEAHGVSLEPDDLEVRRDGPRTTVWAAYREGIEFVPKLYTRDQLFEFEVTVNPVRPLSVDDLK